MDKLTVTQEARDAAAEYCREYLGNSNSIAALVDGRADWDPLVQAFAKAIAEAEDRATRKEREACLWLVTKRADDLAHEPAPEFGDHRQFEAGRDAEAHFIATAIRARGDEQ